MNRSIYTILLFCLCYSAYGNEDKKIALLFLTRSDLNHTAFWKEWVDSTKCTIYNHSKTPPTDPWLSQHRISDIQPNEWGYLLLAQQALLKEALKNSLNEKFVFLSELCIPLHSCKHVYDTLMATPNSHMRWYEIWWKDDPNRTLIEFPSEHQYGNHQWIILNRKHAQMIANDNYWIHLAMQHVCCDEAYPSTFFSMCGVLGEFNNELTTFVDWDRGSPYLFTQDNEENYQILIDAKNNPDGRFAPRKCLFARKFSTQFPINGIQKVCFNEFQPIDLISPKRADVIAKYIYAKHREWGTKCLFGYNVYYSHLKVWNGFHEGIPPKQGFDDFQSAFHKLLDSLKTQGFNPSYPIPVGPADVICNGAHRLAGCLLYNIPTQIERVPTQCDYGYSFFKGLNLEPKYLDAMALEYCELKPDSYIFIVFPSAIGKTSKVEDILNTYSTIVYKKEVEFTKQGALNLILTAYEHEPFIRNLHDAQNKATACFPDKLLKTNKAKVYLVESKSLQLIQQCKAEIRALFNISNHSVHSTDTHLEAKIMARALFNDNSIHCLNHRNNTPTPCFDHYFERYRAWIDSNVHEREWFCVDGGAVMAAYGLRDCNDLDFLFYKNESPKIDIPGIENHNYQLMYYSLPLDDILFDPANYFFYKGVKFCTLSVLKRMKERRRETKDIIDLKLIYNHNTQSPSKSGKKPLWQWKRP